MKTRLGATQKAVIEHLVARGGACSSWDLRHVAYRGAAGLDAVTRAAQRLLDRGMLKRAGAGAGMLDHNDHLNQVEYAAFLAATRRQPRASSFWILAIPD